MPDHDTTKKGLNLALGICAAAFVACYRSSPPVSHMWGHYEEVADLQMAVIDGDLEQARKQGRWIMEHEAMPGLPAGSEPYEREMRTQAERVAVADDLRQAADATGAMGRTCADCHITYDVEARLEHAGAHDLVQEADSNDVARHVSVADHLWDGLIGASEALWSAGARGLEAVPWEQLGSSAGPPPAVVGDVRLLADSLRGLGRRAASEADLDLRAKTYGEVLSHCASCHNLVRKGRE